MNNVNIEELRRRMLEISRIDGPHRADGFTPATRFTQAKDDHGNPRNPDNLSDDDTIDQIGWLVANGLLEERHSPPLGGDRPSFRHRAFRLSAKGWQLRTREIPPIPGVADDRLEA